MLPIQKLQIKTVVTDLSPGSTDQRQIMAVFQKDGKDYAFPIGSVRAGNYQIYSDNMLYIQDPHELYKHWPADVWQAIEKHEVKPGMNELQADFAIGMGIPQQQSDPAVKTVNYPNGGIKWASRSGTSRPPVKTHFTTADFSSAGPSSLA